MTDASDVTPQQVGIYTTEQPHLDIADAVEITQQEEDTYFANGALRRVTKIAIPRQYDEPTVPPMAIQTMQEDILRAIGLVPEHHANDMVWSFQIDSPYGQKVTLARPVMSLTTTREIWSKITAITGGLAFFWSPSERCMDVLILLANPAENTLRGYPIRENYHILQLIDYVFYREPNWVPGFKFVFDETLPYFKPEFVVAEDKFEEREIPDLRRLIAMRDKEERVTQQSTQRRVLESFKLRFPAIETTAALGNLLNMIDRIPTCRTEVDRDKFFRGLCAQKAILIQQMDEELGKNTLHVTVDHNDPDPVHTVELIKSAVGQFRKQLPETILVHLDKFLPRGYDRSLAMPDELVPLVPDSGEVTTKSLLLGGNLSSTDQEHMLNLERELLTGVNGDGVVDERSINSFYYFLHQVISGRVDALDLEVGSEIQAGNKPCVRIRPR